MLQIQLAHISHVAQNNIINKFKVEYYFEFNRFQNGRWLLIKTIQSVTFSAHVCVFVRFLIC